MSRLDILSAAQVYCRIFEPVKGSTICGGCFWEDAVSKHCEFPLKLPHHDLKKIIKEFPCHD